MKNVIIVLLVAAVVALWSIHTFDSESIKSQKETIVGLRSACKGE